MRQIISFVMLFLLSIPLQGGRVSIIPQPLEVVEQNGVFTFNSLTKIVVPKDKDYQRVAGYLSKALGTTAGLTLNTSVKAPGKNYVEFRRVKDLDKEGYRLTVSTDAVIIESSQANGAFYGLQSLYQLLPPEVFGEKKAGIAFSAPCCKIADKPRFVWRGLHLDVCSHFFGPLDVKRYIDLIAMHKGNVFHWHLTEDQGWRIQIKKYPLLTEKGSVRKETVIGTYKSKFYDGTPYGGYYTQDEIRDIVKYAADRFITIIPEIEMPGHALAAISCYPELSCQLEDKYEVGTRWGIYRQVYCPKEETFEFLENALSEVFTLFPSKIVHIGGDECPKTSWKKCPHCQALIKKLGLKDEFELQSYFVQRIEKFANAHGRQIVGWDEILQGGLAPNAMVMSWLGEAGGVKAARQHHYVVMTPYQKYYLDYYQADPATEQICMDAQTTLKTMYDYNPVPDSLTADERKYILGVQGCVWTEYMKDMQRVEYMAFPRACAICESGWSSAANKDWVSFTRRLEHHFLRLRQKNINYCQAFYNVQIEAHKDGPWNRVVVLAVDAPDAEIRYTLDGTEPTTRSEAYSMPFTINQSQVVKARAFRQGKPLGRTMQKGF
ncbi:hexosaminidase [Prevotella sp. KH2C16]|nr:hexosaminidase [Prevotella sp. KH2C16]